MQYNYSVEEHKSKFHKDVMSYIRDNHPLFQIQQEKSITIDGHTLFCDICIISPLKIIIEINPRQHYEFTPFFHGTLANFKSSQKRDSMKLKWAEMNGYDVIILTEDDFPDGFKNKLKERFE